MPLTGQPPNYTRGYDYYQHSVDQPSVPQPGDKLNQDFDDIATAINDGNTAIQGITNPDGSLKDGIVGPNNFAPGFYDQLVDDASEDLQPYVDAAQAASQAAQTAANTATAAATAADLSAQDAAGAVTDATTVFQQARAYAGLASDKATAAANSASAAANSASTAQDAMVGAEDWQELSFKWAEYLAGPVEPAPPGWPEAIDDGLWSAKWWALQARQIVGAWGSLYLGAFPHPPAPDGTQVWPPGSLYFDTTYDQMMVWDGTHWKPISAPAAAAQGNYTYMATEDQQDFTGVDLAGKTPSFDPNFPEPCDVHVNGVRLVADDLAGGVGMGDYTIDYATPTLHINAPLSAGSIVQWDLFVPPAKLAPGAVTSYKLLNMDLDPDTNEPGQFDGVTKTFPIRYIDPTTGMPTLATVGDGVQLQIVLDGVPQEPGVEFTTNGSDIVYAEAPQPGTRFWGVWFKPGLPS